MSQDRIREVPAIGAEGGVSDLSFCVANRTN